MTQPQPHPSRSLQRCGCRGGGGRDHRQRQHACTHVYTHVHVCAWPPPPPAPRREGGRDIWGLGSTEVGLITGFQPRAGGHAPGRGGPLGNPVIFRRWRASSKGASRHFPRKPQSGLSWPQREHNDRCILQQAGSEWVRPACLLSDESLLFFFFLSFADSLGLMCFSLFSPFPPAWKNG